MPFIPAIIGAALISGGAGIGAAALSKKKSSSTPASTALTTQQQGLIDSQKQIADYSLSTGKPLIAKATGSYDDALSFYKKIMTGSDSDIMGLFNADEFTKSADESQATAYNLSGRSGARAAVLGQTTEDRSAQLQRILSQIKLNAPGQIANIGQAYANLGTGLIGSASGANTSASNILFSQQELANQAADRRAQLISSILGSVGSVAGVIAASKSKSGGN